MNSQITQDEQQKNPDAAYQALKFYNYQITQQKKRDGPGEVIFKPLVTQADIEDESKDIDNYVNLGKVHTVSHTLTHQSNIIQFNGDT